MANPRYLSRTNEPTVELLQKIARAKQVYFGNLEEFCSHQSIDSSELKKIDKLYLIGSHATEGEWHNDTSDIDFKLVMPDAIPMDLFNYKRKVLDPILCSPEGEKFRWIDLFFVREDYQVLNPRFDLTQFWNKI